MLGQASSKMGYNLSPPLEKSVADYRGATYQSEMLPILEKKPDLIMVVIQNNKSDLYATTKKLCVVKHPTPSQVNCSHNFLKNLYISQRRARKFKKSPGQKNLVKSIYQFHEEFFWIFSENGKYPPKKSVKFIHFI